MYSIVPDDGSGDFDVARNSTARYLGADGLIKTAAIDEPRIEFNPDGSYKGLLVEPQRTNLVLRSEEFDNAYWTKDNATITANQATAPDGTLSADLLSETTSSTFHTIYSNVFNTAAVVHSGSIFLKKGTGATAPDYVSLYLSNGAGGFGTNRASVNVSNGTISQQVGCSVTSQSYGNGWFRFTVTPTSAALGANARIFLAFNNNNPTPSVILPIYVGATTSDVFIWGAQLEAASTASSYIPTVASTVTRVADAVSKTGASALIGQTEGTIYVEVDIQRDAAGSLVVIDGGNPADFIATEKTATRTIRVRIRRAGGTITTIITSSVLAIGVHKIALGYTNGDYALYIDGVSAGTSTNSTNYPDTTLTQVSLASASYGFFNDHIKAAALLPTRLSNAQLEALTS
jgi:hypothetical protein